MSNITVRYESSINTFLTRPFEIGLRHLKVAFCDSSNANLLLMAKERIIYRPGESSMDKYNPLTKTERLTHLITGTLETFGYLAGFAHLGLSLLEKSGYTPIKVRNGYLTVIVPLIVSMIVSIADRILNFRWYPKGSFDFQTHMNEGGAFDSYSNYQRKNPFHKDGKTDLFYQGASWIKN